MAQRVTANAADLRTFAARLGSAMKELGQVESGLRSAMTAVGSTWKDPQKEKCEKEIQLLVANLRKFQREAEVQKSYCTRLAAHIEATP